MDRPITIAEYSSWLQLICAESAVCSHDALQLTERVEKIAAVKETLAHRLHETKQKLIQLEEETREIEKTAKPVRECLAEAESKLAELTKENEQLKLNLAEHEAPIGKALKNLRISEDRLEVLDKEQSKLMFLRRCLSQCITMDNVWDALPSLLVRDRIKEAIQATAGDLSSWEELWKC